VPAESFLLGTAGPDGCGKKERLPAWQQLFASFAIFARFVVQIRG
jgi:hypothetical protein